MGRCDPAFGRDWLEAAAGATIMIGLAWDILLTGGLSAEWLAERARALRQPFQGAFRGEGM